MSRKITVTIEGQDYTVEVGDLQARPVQAVVNGRTYLVHVQEGGSSAGPAALQVTPAENRPVANRPQVPPQGRPEEASHKPASHSAPNGKIGTITAPLPGDIAEIRVKPGDTVRSGDVLCVLEAMKMKNKIHASTDGVVKTVAVRAGQAVEYGDVLVTLE